MSPPLTEGGVNKEDGGCWKDGAAPKRAISYSSCKASGARHPRADIWHYVIWELWVSPSHPVGVDQSTTGGADAQCQGGGATVVRKVGQADEPWQFEEYVVARMQEAGRPVQVLFKGHFGLGKHTAQCRCTARG
jgi:hypothetical protein